MIDDEIWRIIEASDLALYLINGALLYKLQLRADYCCIIASAAKIEPRIKAVEIATKRAVFSDNSRTKVALALFSLWRAAVSKGSSRYYFPLLYRLNT